MRMEFISNYAMDYAWVIGTVSVILLYLIKWYIRSKRLPPGPRGFPIVGYLPFMGNRPEKTAFKLSKKYGKIMTIRMGTEDAVFLNDYDSVHEAFVKNAASVSGRRTLPQTAAITKGNGLVCLDYGLMWKSQRKFGLVTLRGFGVGKKRTETVALEELRYLNEEIRNNCGKSLDIMGLLHKAISNNICGVALGRRFNYTDKQFCRIIKVMTSFGGKLATFVNRLIMFSPTLQHIPPISIVHKKFLKSYQDVVDWLAGIVKEHQTTYDEDNLRDFIDAFIMEQRKGSDDSFNDEQLVQYIFDLFFAGTETTSGTLRWSLLCLIHYPKTQVKLRNEIMKVIGSSGIVSMEKKPDMPYTNAFIQEIYRYRTMTPLGFPHNSNADTEINGYVIPKGTQVISNLWAVHNDPNLWKEPEKFLPERFLDEQGNFISSKYVIPFSVGPRHCVGEQLAQMEVFMFLVGMVQKFEFLPDPNAEGLPNIDDGAMGLAYVPSHFTLVAKEL